MVYNCILYAYTPCWAENLWNVYHMEYSIVYCMLYSTIILKPRGMRFLYYRIPNDAIRRIKIPQWDITRTYSIWNSIGCKNTMYQNFRGFAQKWFEFQEGAHNHDISKESHQWSYVNPWVEWFLSLEFHSNVVLRMANLSRCFSLFVPLLIKSFTGV